MEIFLQNLERIAEHNIRYRNGEVTYTLGMNRFGDMTHPEFVARFNGYKSNGLAKSRQNLHETSQLPGSSKYGLAH